MVRPPTGCRAALAASFDVGKATPPTNGEPHSFGPLAKGHSCGLLLIAIVLATQRNRFVPRWP